MKIANFHPGFPMKWLLAILLLVCLGSACPGQTGDTLLYSNLDPSDFHLLMDSPNGHLLIDVREPFEFRKNRIAGSINIPSAAALNPSDTLDAGKMIFVYCTTGYRSGRAAQRLCDRGFINVFNLKGGITAWKKARLPIDRKRQKKK